MSSAVIRLEHVSKTFRLPLDRSTTLKYRLTHPRSSTRYRNFDALHDVSFSVQPGEFLGILGHNGSGKSTLLKILSRIYTADSGVVEVNGRVSPFLELGVGFNPELTARENVYLNGAVIGLTRADLRGRVDEIIEFADLADRADQKLKNFSSGMQVRLAFSVAIQAEAAVLLMDEVLAVGDARFQEKCFAIFAQYRRDGRTVVLVTHDLGAIESHCDRAVLLDHGRMVVDGDPASVVADYRRLIGLGGGDAHAPAVRYGDDAVVVSGVRIVDRDGSPTRIVDSGEPVTIEVECTTRLEVGPLVLGLSLGRADGVIVSEVNTEADSEGIDCPPIGGRRTVRYRIDRLPLLAGEYHLDVELRALRGVHVHDHLERAVSFRVVDTASRGGLLDLGGRWSADHVVPV